MTDQTETAANRIRTYLRLTPGAKTLGGEIAYSEDFRSEDWPRGCYAPTRDDVETLLTGLARAQVEVFQYRTALQGAARAAVPSAVPAPATDDTDLTEADIDRMMAAGVPVQIVTAPPATYGATPATDRAGLREQIAEALYRHSHPGWATHYADLDRDERDTYLGRADAVLSVLPAFVDRAAVAELAQALRLTREYVGADLLPAVEGWSWYDALRRHAPHELPAATSAAEAAPADTGHANNEAPADPWSISYHRLGPAQNNPNVCICGLGPDAVIHNEPPHPFNARLKAAHHIPVGGICTDCHHHETAACHTTSEQPADAQQQQTEA